MARVFQKRINSYISKCTVPGISSGLILSWTRAIHLVPSLLLLHHALLEAPFTGGRSVPRIPILYAISVARLKLEVEGSVDILLAFFDGTLETPSKRHRQTATKKKSSGDRELQCSEFLTVAKVDLKLVDLIGFLH